VGDLVCISFILLARSAPFDIFLCEFQQIEPPVVDKDLSIHAIDPRMSGGGTVMIGFQYISCERVRSCYHQCGALPPPSFSLCEPEPPPLFGCFLILGLVLSDLFVLGRCLDYPCE